MVLTSSDGQDRGPKFKVHEISGCMKQTTIVQEQSQTLEGSKNGYQMLHPKKIIAINNWETSVARSEFLKEAGNLDFSVNLIFK